MNPTTRLEGDHLRAIHAPRIRGSAEAPPISKALITFEIQAPPVEMNGHMLILLAVMDLKLYGHADHRG
jgi:hypothetical protein